MIQQSINNTLFCSRYPVRYDLNALIPGGPIKTIKMSNKSQTLLDIFQEILAASGNSSEGINETQIVSLMREQSKYGGHELEATLLKMMKEARRKLNLTLTPCDYCVGDSWELLHAYNGVHGYVSLLVSRFYGTIVGYQLVRKCWNGITSDS